MARFPYPPWSLDELTYHQREVVRLREGLADGQRHPWKEVARIFNRAEVWARKVEQVARMRLQGLAAQDLRRPAS